MENNFWTDEMVAKFFRSHWENIHHKRDCMGSDIEYAKKFREKHELSRSQEKPPLGLTPLHIHRNQRLNEINEAIARYLDANMIIPKEWLNERESIISFIITP